MGKTTLARTALGQFGEAGHYATADDVAQQDTLWIERQWEIARRKAAGREGGTGGVSLGEFLAVPAEVWLGA